MDFRILGPLEVFTNGQPLALGGSKQRAVLALLLLHANETVSVDRLIEALWGERAPAGAVQSVRVHISRLRKVLDGGGGEGNGPSRLVTKSGGYQLNVEDDALDLARFERLYAEGQRALASDPPRAAELLNEALALWRGPALADLAYEPFAQAEAARLDELRVAALEDRIEADLELGRHAAVASEIEPLIAEHPLRERLRRLQMLALYRCGRQAEALEAYRAARRTLVEEVGVEPGPEMRELHEAILRQDPALDAPARPQAAPPAPTAERPATAPPPVHAVPGLGRVPALAVVAALGLAVVLLVIGVVSGDDEADTTIAENSVALLDPSSGEVRSEIPLGDGPGPSATDGTSVWIANTLDDTVSRVDAESGQVATIDIGGEPAGVAVGGEFAWVTDATEGTVEQVDPEANRVVGSLKVGNGPAGVAVAFRAVWVVTAVDGAVTRVDLATGEVTDRIPVGSTPTAIAAGAGSLWVTDEAAGTVIRVEPGSGRVSEAIAVGNGPSSVAFGDGAVWVANRIDGTVSRIDPATDSVTSTVGVGAEPGALAVDDQGVWVASSGEGTLSRLEPDTGEAGELIEVGGSPSGLAITDGGVWTSVLASRESHRGGTLRLNWEPQEFRCRRCVDPIDYDNFQTWELASLAYDGLITYRRVGAAAGSTLVGNLATDVPEPSADGRTYVFELRSGIRFSDGEPVRPEDFRSSIERLLRVNGRGSFAPYFKGIAGARECVAFEHRVAKVRRTAEPASCDLSQGIETDAEAGTITVHLTAPDADFLHKLALPLASVLPQDAPPRFARRPIAGTGPYRIVDFDPERGGHLVRNPEFEVWSQDARPDGFPDEITIEVSDDPQAQLAAVERGDADYVTVAGPFGGPLSPAGVRELAVRHADRLHSAPLPETDYLFLNTRLPPFDDARVRRALNFAVDRRAVVELAGGNLLAQPTCQAVPPGFPGHRAYCPYTLNPNPAGSWVAPDLAAAQRLVRASGTRGASVEVWTWPERKPIASYFVSLLRQLGYRSSLRVLPIGRYYSTVYDPKAAIQVGYNGWYADYLAPANFTSLYECSDPDNFSRYCDQGVDGQLDRALAVQGSDPTASIALWQDADHAITDAAPSVELLNRKSAVLVSERVENVQQHPLWGVLEDQLWVE
jgi:YVTN family beta-propeller protein